MIKVKAVQDESGHWYLIPNSLLADFDRLLENGMTDTELDEFENTFNQYRTEGCLNNVQLYIESEEEFN